MKTDKIKILQTHQHAFILLMIFLSAYRTEYTQKPSKKAIVITVNDCTYLIMNVIDHE